MGAGHAAVAPGRDAQLQPWLLALGACRCWVLASRTSVPRITAGSSPRFGLLQLPVSWVLSSLLFLRAARPQGSLGGAEVLGGGRGGRGLARLSPGSGHGGGAHVEELFWGGSRSSYPALLPPGPNELNKRFLCSAPSAREPVAKAGTSHLICLTFASVQTTKYLSPAAHVPGGFGSSSRSIWSARDARFPFPGQQVPRAASERAAGPQKDVLVSHTWWQGRWGLGVCEALPHPCLFPGVPWSRRVRRAPRGCSGRQHEVGCSERPLRLRLS